jgi:hypothetical protein
MKSFKMYGVICIPPSLRDVVSSTETILSPEHCIIMSNIWYAKENHSPSNVLQKIIFLK